MIENSGSPEASGGREHSLGSETAAKRTLPGDSDEIYDLLDIVEESPDKIHELIDIIEEPKPLLKEEPQGTLVINGRGYQEVLPQERNTPDLLDIAVEKPLAKQPMVLLEDELKREILATVERMTREMFPDIAERIIREEIEKLKEEPEGDSIK